MKIAIFLGLLGAVAVCGLSYFNDNLMRQTLLVGNFIPLSVYGTLILFIVVANPLLFYFRKKFALSSKQLALALVITLAACCIPGSSFGRIFTNSIILPHKFEKAIPGWKEMEVIKTVPDKMLADVSQNESEALAGFTQGLAVGGKHIEFSKVPWYAWKRTLMFWLPLVFILWIGFIGLSLAVHQQWSKHEHLPYPIANFAHALLPGKNRAVSSVFRTKIFWIGAGIVFFIHMNNYMCTWFPGLIKVPVSFSFESLQILFPKLVSLGGLDSFLVPTLYFTPIAFAYFLASDLSFSIGIGPLLWVVIKTWLLSYGLISELQSMSLFSPSPATFMNFGAYLAAFVILIYMGRYYYSQVFRQALFIPTKEKAPPATVWGVRVFMLSMIIFTLEIAMVGLDWQIAALYTIGLVILYVVMSRIVAETGLFWIQGFWAPGMVILGFFSPKALGPQMIAILLLLNPIFAIDPRETLMPFIVNSNKLVELQGLKIGKTSIFYVIAILIGLAVAVPVTLYFQYDMGTNMSDTWSTEDIPVGTFDSFVRAKQKLIAQDNLEFSESISGWRRFAEIAPKKNLMVCFASGALLFFLFTMGRLRFSKWPLHPVLFLTWTTFPGEMFFASFLVGWFFKVVITKYGGEAMYKRIKPLMFGLIGGEMVAGIVIILIGFIFYFFTGDLPKNFEILPG